MLVRWIRNGVNLATDATIAAANLPLLPFVLGTRLPLFDKQSEINLKSYGSLPGYVGTIYEALRFPFFPEVGEYVAPEVFGQSDKYQDEKWYFMNGICTNAHMWKVNAEKLHEIFGRNIHPLHNRSKGFTRDIVECISGRTFDKPSDPAILFLVPLIDDLLNEEVKKLVIIAHSQGGIISSNLLKLLETVNGGKYKAAMKKKLELYTFASAADEQEPTAKHIEHFSNNLDFVARIGAVLFENDVQGRHYRLCKTGHLLNIHYLPDFLAGKYININTDNCRKSQLHSYVVSDDE